MGGSVVLRANAERLVQVRSVGRVGFLEDRYQPARLPDGRFDVVDGEGWGTVAEKGVQLGASRTLLLPAGTFSWPWTQVV